MNNKYDVIVVGGGPAGGTAAWYLGQAGMQVLVLERESLPRYKACGGGVSAQILRQFPFSFEPVIESKARSISYALGKQVVTVPLPRDSVRMVMREDFDLYLLKHTLSEIRQGVAVQSVEEKPESVIVKCRDGGQFESQYLIGADGANSVVAHSLKLRTGKVMAGAIEVEAAVPEEVFTRFVDKPLFIFGEISMGYLWIFPKSDHLSVGIGALHPRPGELQATLERVMSRFGISIEGQPHKGQPLPVYNRRESIGTSRTLLVGDAAGLVDPFTGEGIRFAIKSGRLAAEAILANQPERYAASIDRQIGLNHRLGKILTNLFYCLPGPCFELGARNPFVTRAFVDMLADQTDYGSLLAQIFATLPLFLFTEVVASLAGIMLGKKVRDKVRKAVYSL